MYLPKVSIITVCYNSAMTIEDTINSVINQTYKNIEYIIIDGGSQDDTLEIIKKYEKEITLFVTEPDNGLYHAMNKGIMRSTGEIVGIINSDDWYDLNTVKRVVERFSQGNCEIVYGRQTHVYTDGTMRPEENSKLEELPFRMMLPHPSVFVRKMVYEMYGIFDGKYKIAADFDLMLRFYSRKVKMVEIPYNLAYFRQGGISSEKYSLTAKEFREVALQNWDGVDPEIRDKIEKYSEFRSQRAENEKRMERLLKGHKEEIPDMIKRCFQQERDYAIFGIGAVGVESWQFFREGNIDVGLFLDNNAKKWGTSFLELEVHSPELLNKEKKNIIISTIYYQEDIKNQLNQMGYREGKDYVVFETMIEEMAKICKIL